MDSFEAALDFVHSTLCDLHARGVQLRASMESLTQLSALSVSVAEAPLVESGRRAAEAPAAAPQVQTFAVERPAAPPVRIEAAPRPATATVPVLPFESDSAPALMLPADDPGLSKAQRLEQLRGPALVCTRCPQLVRFRTQVVFGVGNADAEVMFVGEAPGEDEDKKGEPFVGKAGQLLTKIIETMGFQREEVYIANVLKCRPDMPPGVSGNRKPTSDEMRTCLPYLERQIQIIQPRALVALGATAMEGLLGETAPMNRLRGRWHDFRGIPLMATYHPAYLLRNQALSEKRKVWEDMLLVLERLKKPVNAKQRSYFLPKD